MQDIKFYSINDNNTEDNKALNKEFDDALKTVLEKDVRALDEKINKIILNVITSFSKCGIVFSLDKKYGVQNIDELINLIADKINDLIMEKASIKIGIFTSNKREKKEKIKTYDEVIEELNRYQDNINSVKTEYEMLKKRNNNIEETKDLYDTEEKKEEKEEDPLERTISFYMNKE